MCATPARNTPGSSGPLGPLKMPRIATSPITRSLRTKRCSRHPHLWSQPIKRVRAMDGVIILDGRRLSMHLLLQRDVATQVLADPVLRDQGLLSRVLVAAPDSIAGTRLYRDPRPEDEAAIRA